MAELTEYDRLKAQKDAMVEKAREKVLAPLREENAHLRIQLASSYTLECALREAIANYRHWYDTCSRKLAQNWEELAGRASEALDAALAAPAPPCSHQIKAEELATALAARDARQRSEGAAAELERIINECGEHAGMLVDKDALKARAAELRKGAGRG